MTLAELFLPLNEVRNLGIRRYFEDSEYDLNGLDPRDGVMDVSTRREEVQINLTSKLLIVDVLVIVQSFSRLPTQPLARRKFSNVMISAAVPSSSSYISSTPDLPISVVHIPFTSASMELQSSSDIFSFIKLCMPRIDCHAWPSYHAFLFWRLDLEPLSIILGRLESGEMSADDFFEGKEQ